MKSLYIYVLMALSICSMVSCSDDEDTSPSYADVNYFAPSDDDNSELANLQRDFYKETGCYLIFNDTLQHVQIGTDSYGKPIYKTENVNIDYNLASQGTQYDYVYSYIKGIEEQRKAAKFVKDEILPRLSGKRPFAILIANDMQQMSYDKGVLTPVKKDLEYGQDPYPSVHQGVRCLSISMSDGEAYTDPKVRARILGYLAYLQFNNENTDFFADFIAPVNNYSRLTSWRYKSDFGYEEEYDEDLAHSLGFVQDDYDYRFPTKYDDRLDYASAVFQYSVSEFEEKFADYPICIERFKVMRQMLLDYGCKLD